MTSPSWIDKRAPYGQAFLGGPLQFQVVNRSKYYFFVSFLYLRDRNANCGEPVVRRDITSVREARSV